MNRKEYESNKRWIFVSSVCKCCQVGQRCVNKKSRTLCVMIPLEDENRDLEDPTTRRQRERQKVIGLKSKTTTLHVHHTFFYISLPVMHNYDLKMPNFAFYGEREQATTNFSLYFLPWIWLRVRLHLIK